MEVVNDRNICYNTAIRIVADGSCTCPAGGLADWASLPGRADAAGDAAATGFWLERVLASLYGTPRLKTGVKMAERSAGGSCKPLNIKEM